MTIESDRIRHRLYEVEWETGEVISSIIRNKKEWNSRPYRSMPIHKVIEREGIGFVGEWRRDLIQSRIERAYETLEDAQILQESRRWKACVNRLYYACYYAVSGLLLQKNLFYSKHKGIRRLFNLHFVKSAKVPKEYGMSPRSSQGDSFPIEAKCKYRTDVPIFLKFVAKVEPGEGPAASTESVDSSESAS
jgi:uncharacterized protein (UPF0332 family)